MNKLTHLDAEGHASMVDVSEKPVTRRTASASAVIRARPDVVRAIADGTVPKGDVLATARIAGIMAAKKTAELIPLCHPIPISSVRIDVQIGDATVELRSHVTTTASTGVEMEALVAASIAALSIYDMCKALDRSMECTHVRLESKDGGRSGTYEREGSP